MPPFFQLPLAYIIWHYTVAWADLLRLYINLSWFLFHFFSIRILLETLFSPWKRLHFSRKKEEGGLLGALILNMVTRLVGFLIRGATILSGFFSLALLSFMFLLAVVLWTVLPFLLFIFLFVSLQPLLKLV